MAARSGSSAQHPAPLSPEQAALCSEWAAWPQAHLSVVSQRSPCPDLAPAQCGYSHVGKGRDLAAPTSATRSPWRDQISDPEQPWSVLPTPLLPRLVETLAGCMSQALRLMHLCPPLWNHPLHVASRDRLSFRQVNLVVS